MHFKSILFLFYLFYLFHSNSYKSNASVFISGGVTVALAILFLPSQCYSEFAWMRKSAEEGFHDKLLHENFNKELQEFVI